MASAACRSETQAYRNCLKDSRDSGGGGTKKCKSVAVSLEQCRERWRKANRIEKVQFDGTRILPNHKCRPLNAKVQHCLKWKKGDETQCQTEIKDLNTCMKNEQGVVAALGLPHARREQGRGLVRAVPQDLDGADRRGRAHGHGGLPAGRALRLLRLPQDRHW